MSDPKHREEGEVLVKDEAETDEPRMYKVVLLNDDYTSMEFVVMVLERVFHKSFAEAKTVMLNVHERGSGVAGLYPKEVAETKIATVHHMAQQNEFPLRCSMEPA